jgi:hypothetical protein
MRIVTLSLAIAWLAVGTTMAADACKAPPACTEVQTCGEADHCGRCGCAGKCEKRCYIVCEMKEIKKHVWIVHCEEFAPLLPGCGKGCNGCGCCDADQGCVAEPACCGGCDKGCDPCAAEKNKCLVPPKCGKIRTTKKLEKKEVVCKVPRYKCVVVYCCPSCCAHEGCDSQPTAPVPGKPAAPAPTPAKAVETAPLPPAANVSYVK